MLLDVKRCLCCSMVRIVSIAQCAEWSVLLGLRRSGLCCPGYGVGLRSPGCGRQLSAENASAGIPPAGPLAH